MKMLLNHVTRGLLAAVLAVVFSQAASAQNQRGDSGGLGGIWRSLLGQSASDATGEDVISRQVRIVGSSTVFPFAAAVAERFGRDTSFKTPIVESTGTGGGMNLFCAGTGSDTPDIANASRRMKEVEFSDCSGNGVSVTEVRIGYDGIVLANAIPGPRLRLSMRQVFQALAARVPVDGGLVANPYRTWKDIDPALPDVEIEVLGPPPTSGTRDAFVELAMEKGAQTFPSLAALRREDKDAFKAIAHHVREDGAFIEAGENDNLIVQKLKVNPDAVGIFGFSFLDQNTDTLRGAIMDGVVPIFDNIVSGDYGISRSLYFYVKRDHGNRVPGLREYIGAFTDEDAWGGEGYLADKGFIPLAEEDRAAEASAARNLEPVTLDWLRQYNPVR